MKVLEEIAQNDWDFVLFKTDECYVINVLFSHSAVDFYRSFKLSAGEGNLDFEGIKQLSERIRTNYESFKDREIKPPVTKETI